MSFLKSFWKGNTKHKSKSTLAVSECAEDASPRRTSRVFPDRFDASSGHFDAYGRFSRRFLVLLRSAAWNSARFAGRKGNSGPGPSFGGVAYSPYYRLEVAATEDAGPTLGEANVPNAFRRCRHADISHETGYQITPLGSRGTGTESGRAAEEVAASLRRRNSGPRAARGEARASVINYVSR